MKKLLFTFISFLSFLYSLNPNSIFADATIAITDRYSCSRLGDGKLHIIKPSATRFTVMKKGAAENDYAKELKRITTKIDLLDGYKIKIENTLDINVIRKLAKLLTVGENDASLSTKEKAIITINNAVKTAKARRATIKIYLKAIAKCENQKYPGLDSIGASASVIYVRGSVASTAGYLISVPKPAANSRSVNLCLSYLDPFTPAGIPPEKAANLVLFTNSVCSNPALVGNGVLDCTGPVPSGYLSFYLKKINFFERSPEPSSDTVLNQLAQLSAISIAFKVQPVSKATGSACEKLRQ